ncbi:MAG: hypothetical protein EOS18_00470 [Mesorhizobium sp.]|nr:MAG: hypothetical protein EOS18_00470 [Mesorhizobium sp.]
MSGKRQVQRAYYDFFEFLFGAGAPERAVSVLSRRSRSRAVFASRAARSTSINSRAASVVRSFLSRFFFSVNACLCRIVLPDLTAQRCVAAPNHRRQIGFHPHSKKVAISFGTADCIASPTTAPRGNGKDAG